MAVICKCPFHLLHLIAYMSAYRFSPDPGLSVYWDTVGEIDVVSRNYCAELKTQFTLNQLSTLPLTASAAITSSLAQSNSLFTPTPTMTTAATGATQAGGGLSLSNKINLGVGIGIGLPSFLAAFVGTLLVLLAKRRRNKNKLARKSDERQEPNEGGLTAEGMERGEDNQGKTWRLPSCKYLWLLICCRHFTARRSPPRVIKK